MSRAENNGLPFEVLDLLSFVVEASRPAIGRSRRVGSMKPRVPHMSITGLLIAADLRDFARCELTDVKVEGCACDHGA
jgi:hypothetical protein